MPILGAIDGSGDSPGAPVMGTATAGNTRAVITFTPPSYIGKGSISYTAVSSPGGFTGTAAGSPIEVAGLTNGTSYTFTIYGMTDYGIQTATTAASNAVTPFAPPVYPPYGTLLAANQCSGYTLYNLRANGTGGTYQEILEVNSTSCGYTPPPPPCTAAGTFLTSGCVGQNLYYYYADGNCGSYGVDQGLSTTCGYVPPPSCTCCVGVAVSESRCVPGGWQQRTGIAYNGSCGASGGSGTSCGGGCVGCSCPVVTYWNTWSSTGAPC